MEVDGRVEADRQARLPPSLTRRYAVLLRPRSAAGVRKLREISAANIGHLVTFKVGGGQGWGFGALGLGFRGLRVGVLRLGLGFWGFGVLG